MDFLNLTNLENRPLLKYIMIGVIAVNALVLALLLFGPGRLSAATPQGNPENTTASGEAAAETSEVSPAGEDTETDAAEESDGSDHEDGQAQENPDEDQDYEENGQELFSDDQENADTAEASGTSETAEEGESATAPILELNTDKVTLKVGDYFNYWDYIETVEDRDGSDLSRYIHLSNTPNTYTPGEYVVTYRLTSPVTGETTAKELTVTVE